MQSLLLAIPRSAQFFARITDKWLDDSADFVRTTVPKLIIIGLGAWILIRLLAGITRRITALAERHAHGAHGTTSVYQVRTLASVVRATGIGIITFLAALEILPLLGVDLKPLLASAGVAGVALGLAAQTIVKDVLNGVVLVVEDQFHVGDVVTLAGITGTVEELTLRRTTVRGFDGTLYVIPNSQITNTANMSRDFSVTTLNVSVDFSAPPDEVVALLKKIANDVRNDPAYKDVFLADPQVQGVDAIKGSEVLYPIELKTRARKQFAAVREIHRRIRLALEEKKMLPGSPYRVMTASAAAQGQSPALTLPGKSPAVVAADPTRNPPQEVNPFTGEG
ncbi:MAG TPA: mechanosensitive ion channel family protein [Acidisarcina sp.]|nr:mechanosensitive ion channel family protein [Acidisarcina sp.]